MNSKNSRRPFGLENIDPKKRLGQNFMVDKGILTAMVKAAKINGSNLVIEIGPGTGNLTGELLKKAMFVIAVEKDRDMCRVLKETMPPGDQSRLVVIEKDIRDLTVNQILAAYPKANIEHPPYKVVANLPFYIANPVIRLFLESGIKPQTIMVMVQKEVGERIVSNPPKMTLLSVSIQFYGKPRIVRIVPKGAFWPRPKIDSVILEIVPHNRNYYPDPLMFFNIVRAGFRQPRKQIINNLIILMGKHPLLSRERLSSLLKEGGIALNRRAETFSINDWIKITDLLNPFLSK